MHLRAPSTFVFADLVGFTALTELHGDDAAADLAVDFGLAAAGLAEEHGGSLVKSIGDAVMLRIEHAAEAVHLGLRIHSDLERVAHLPPVRVGMNTGRAVERAGDWFGSAVNIAARVSCAARGGELLMTEATVDAAGDIDGVEVAGLGPQVFKNVVTPTQIYSARRVRTAAAPAVVRLPRLAPAVA